MFKHILVPTDGSEISKRVIRDCIRFAKDSGASVTGLTVISEFSPYAFEAEMLPGLREEYEAESIAYANKCLDEIKNAAKELDVKCETFYVTSNYPYSAIIQTAQERHCDLIAMASHGRKGIKGVLLGSETQKVLTHSQIPVLVFR